MERRLIGPIPLKCAAAAAVNGVVAPSNATEKWRLLEMSESPNLAITADDTDYCTLTPTIGGTGIATARTTKVTGGAARVLATPVNWTLTGSQKQLEITQAAPFKMAITHAASGKAMDTNLYLLVEVLRS